jgi:chromate transport protein ChrA
MTRRITAAGLALASLVFAVVSLMADNLPGCSGADAQLRPAAAAAVLAGFAVLAVPTQMKLRWRIPLTLLVGFFVVWVPLWAYSFSTSDCNFGQ